MTPESILHSIPGGTALIDWFGRVPHFHDAKLLDLALSNKEISTLRVHTWQMTDQTDAQGYYILDKHVVVTITLQAVTHVALDDFDMMPGIIYSFEITKTDNGYQLTWDASYGVSGLLRAKQVSLNLMPGKP